MKCPILVLLDSWLPWSDEALKSRSDDDRVAWDASPRKSSESSSPEPRRGDIISARYSALSNNAAPLGLVSNCAGDAYLALACQATRSTSLRDYLGYRHSIVSRP